jgi:tetratricopeptide (TPR) repeat protein
MKIIRFITMSAVVLFTTIVIAHSQTKEMRKVKMQIGELLKEKVEVYDRKTKVRDNPKDILVHDDRIDFRIKRQTNSLNFSDLTVDSIKFLTFSNRAVIELKNLYLITTNLEKANYARFEELWKDLIYIQKQQGETAITHFEEIASKYRELREKPKVSEEQRKLIVQANLFNQQKNYSKAIELYKMAIEFDQIGYPAAYSNVALLFAQINKFRDAIIYMKEYLLLEPDGSDARSAQDKIYEWEAQIQ